MSLIYGKPIAERLLDETKHRIYEMGLDPGLAVILVGDDTPSHLYVGLKEKASYEIGIRFEKFLFDERALYANITRCIDELNEREDIHGIIVQVPLPEGYPTDEIIARIYPEKDTDGFHPQTIHTFLSGEYAACPVFPRAVIELIRETGENVEGEKGLVIVNSELLGSVMVRALEYEGIQGEYVLSTGTREEIANKSQGAKVIVTACGLPNFITGDMVSEGAIVIDGGVENVGGKVMGDVERSSVEGKARYLSPVPGGVGPVTVATLLSRVTDASIGGNTKTLQ